MKEELKRNEIAKQIVMLNPAIGTSLELIRLLQKHIETKMIFLEFRNQLGLTDSFSLDEKELMREFKQLEKDYEKDN